MEIQYANQAIFPSESPSGLREDWFTRLYPKYTAEKLAFAGAFSYNYFAFLSGLPHRLQTHYPTDLVKMIVCLAGNWQTETAQAIHQFSPGRIWLYRVNQGEGHSLLLPNTSYQVIHVHFPLQRIETLAVDLPVLAGVLHQKKVLNFPIAPVLQPTIAALLHSQYTGAVRRLQFESLSLQLLFNWLSNFPSDTLNHRHSFARQLQQAKEVLDNSPGFVTIGALAREVGLNEFALKKGFKETFQTTIFAYQQDRRLGTAFDLLQHGNLPVSEVAERAGYRSLGSFSDAFYKKFHCRPSFPKNPDRRK